MVRVITVHGISTRGPWQEALEDVFSPHFEYVSIKYPHYRRLGLLKLLLEPWVLFPFGVLVLVLRQSGLIRSMLLWLAALTGVLISAHLASYLRRQCALKAFRRRVTPYMLYGARPHFIAHSLGTYLVATTLRMQDPRVRNIVLTGCVLRKEWDWSALLERNQFAFGQVRNEVCGKDRVARAAQFLKGLIPGFGMAGFSGFRDHPGFVHSIGSPNISCRHCDPKAVAPIHNVLSTECGHSDVFIGPGYAASFWLPFLWSIDPPEYQEFMELCLAAAESHQNGDFADLLIVEAELRERPWRWSGGPFKDYVEGRVRAHPRLPIQPQAPARLADLAIAGVWQAVARARDAADQKGLGWKKQARALNPRMAVTSAVEALML